MIVPYTGSPFPNEQSLMIISYPFFSIKYFIFSYTGVSENSSIGIVGGVNSLVDIF